MLENSKVLEEGNQFEATVLRSSPSPTNQSSEEYVPSGAKEKIWENCSVALLEVASKTCNHIPEEEIRFDCKFDVCATGNPNAAQDSVAMEILEVKEAHGLVHFAGDGRCLDSNGHLYIEIKINGTSTDQQCQKILQRLANTSSVRGAEITTSQECLIAVDPDIDPDMVHRWFNFGWRLQQHSNKSAVGAGIVSNTTGTVAGIEKAGSCWKLF